VLDHPDAAVTNAKSEFEIAKLPVSDHEFKVWHEKAGFLKPLKLKVTPGDNEPASIEIASDALKK